MNSNRIPKNNSSSDDDNDANKGKPRPWMYKVPRADEPSKKLPWVDIFFAGIRRETTTMVF